MSATPASPSAMESECRRRHPSMRAGVSGARLQARVTSSLERTGVAHVDVAVAVLAARGRSGLSAEEFASRLGVTVDVVATAETGATPRDRLPGPLRRLVPRPG